MKTLMKMTMRTPTSKAEAFTLIEVLIAAALTGLVASLALAPVIYVIRQVVVTETAYSDETALRQVALFMAKDAAAGLRLAPIVVRVADHEELGGVADDALIVASSAPAKQNLAAGSVVYRIVRRSFMNDAVPGLYRWILPGELPDNVKYENLEAKDGQLAVPYVTGLDVSVFEPPEWVKEYNGALPGGMRFTLSRGEERVEYVFGFPQ
jgi:hypothetical protein